MTVFSEEQVAYLESLPAVESVSGSRIRYARMFRDECLRRYARGEHPVALFREAGLDPKLVGYKRIERAFARWRDEAHMTAKRSAGRPSADDTGFGTGGVAGTSALYSDDGVIGGGGEAYADGAGVAAGAATAGTVGGGAFGDRDPRDVLILQQMHYIHYLEQRLHQLGVR